MPIDKFIGILERETDVSKLSELSKRLDLIKKIHSDNDERQRYWEKAAIWSTRRLGEATKEGKAKGEIAVRGQPKKKGDTVAPFSLADLGLSKKSVQRAEKLASVPAAAVTAYIESQEESGQEITKAGLLRSSKPKKPRKPNPAKPKKADRDDGQGYEPHEAAKPLEKLRTTLSKAAREWGDVKMILGEPLLIKSIFAGIDSATIALEKYRRQFKKKIA